MANEIEIKRGHWFNGQFLQEGDFLDEQAYHLHMRRRWAYAMFDQSGVVQSSPTELTVTHETGTTIRVRAGLAIGRVDDVREAKEIVLRDDQLIDLTAPSLGDVIGPGDTARVTIHYEEQEQDPSSEGTITGNTRIQEHARITVHSSDPPATAPNGEPYIRLSNVEFDSMGIIDTPPARQYARINNLLIGTAPRISLDQTTVDRPGLVTFTATATGGFVFTGVTAADVAIVPPGGIVGGVPGGVTTTILNPPDNTIMEISFTFDDTASTGGRMLTVTNGPTEVTAAFSVQAVGLSVTGADFVNLGDTTLRINGTGFSDTPSAPTVRFASSTGGGFTADVLATFMDANLITVPIAGIPPVLPPGFDPSDPATYPPDTRVAIQGFIEVSSGGIPVTSDNAVTPPPVIIALDGPAGGPTASPNDLLTITGYRFYNVTSIVFGGGVERNTSGPPPLPPFPHLGAGESVTVGETIETPGTILVLVPPGAANGPVRITTDGGTVESSISLTVS